MSSVGRIGSNNSFAKLTEEDVVLIRALWAEGLKQKEIAEKFDISQGQVHTIVSNQAWTHVAPSTRKTRKHDAKAIKGRIHRMLVEAGRPMSLSEIVAAFNTASRKQVANRLSEMQSGAWPDIRIERVKRGMYQASKE